MNKIKKLVFELLSKRPGRRFLHTSKKINESISNNFLVKIMCIVLGTLSICAGIIMLFIPGPGLLFILFGAILFSVCSKSFALFLDKTEQKLRAFLQKKS